MGRCILCGKEDDIISDFLGICINCIREKKDSWKFLEEKHINIREEIGLPPTTPRHGLFRCSICGRGCVLSDGDRGYCGFRIYRKGKQDIVTGKHDKAIGLYYYDPHPTNCVAFPVCPAITGIGYPRYALTKYGEHGYYNIAVFMGGCNMDCLYCQNWEYRLMTIRGKPVLTINNLVNAVNEKTTCTCFFGGDPGPWSTFVLDASRKMLEKAHSIGLKVFRICWETNGLWNPILFKKAVELSLDTGGIVKIDFKAWSPEVYHALTGVDAEHVRIIRDNIKYVVEKSIERKDPPLLVVSTLLVPGYIDEYEIDHMTRFIAELNPSTPYVFLAFHPDYMLTDLPHTSWRHMKKALEIARENGLENIFIGNKWLLGNDY